MDHEVGQQVPAVTAAVDVLVYWRPGCWYCTDLRSQLELAGILYTPIDIWQDPGAAARVRSIADGNETVPTVVIGEHTLVNPSARDVRAVLSEFGGCARPSPRSAGIGRLRASFSKWPRHGSRPRRS